MKELSAMSVSGRLEAHYITARLALESTAKDITCSFLFADDSDKPGMLEVSTPIIVGTPLVLLFLSA